MSNLLGWRLGKRTFSSLQAADAYANSLLLPIWRLNYYQVSKLKLSFSRTIRLEWLWYCARTNRKVGRFSTTRMKVYAPFEITR